MEWEHNCCLCWKHSLLARIDWADADDGNYVPKDFLRSACVATKLLPWSLFWAELNRFQSVPLPTLPRKSSKELYLWNWERRPIRVESWLPNGESRHGWAAKHELVDLNSKFGAQLLDDLFSLLYSVELQAVCRCLLKLKYHGYFNKPSFYCSSITNTIICWVYLWWIQTEARGEVRGKCTPIFGQILVH